MDPRKPEKKKEHYFQALTEKSYDGFGVFGSDGTIYYMSPGLTRINGRTFGERQGASCLEFVHPDDLPKVREAISGSIKNPEKSRAVQARLQHKDGHFLDVEARFTSLLDDPDVGGIVLNIRDVTKETKAQERQRLLASVLEQTTEAVVIGSLDRKIIEWNKGAEKMFGYSLEEVRGNPVNFLEPEERSGEVDQKRSAILEGKGPLAYETVRRKKNGELVQVAVTASMLKGPEGENLGFAVLYRDITKRKAAEAALEKKERYFRSLAEKSYDAVVVVDAGGKISYCSPAMAHIYGYSPEERIGLDGMELLHPKDAGKIREALEEPLKVPGGSGTVQARFKHKKGHFVTVELRATNLLEDPDVRGVVVNYRDITERVKAEEILRNSEKNFRTLIDKILDVILIVDQDGILHYLSPSVQRALGYSADQMEGRNLYDYLLPGDLEIVREALNESLRSVLEKPVEFRLRDSLGKAKTFEAVGVPFTDPLDGGRVVLTARDITERKYLENEILEAGDRERIRIGQDLHDGLGQQLTGIAFLAKALQKKLGTRQSKALEDASKIVRLVNEAAQQARQIAQGLFPAELDSKGLGTALERLAAATHKMFDVDCNFTCVNGAAIPHSQALHLFRIAQEAVNNALKHGKARKIRLGLVSKRGQVILTVTDNGVGISGGKGKEGLGLHTMHYRAKLIGATLDIQKAVGGGTRVTCKFKPGPVGGRKA